MSPISLSSPTSSSSLSNTRPLSAAVSSSSPSASTSMSPSPWSATPSSAASEPPAAEARLTPSSEGGAKEPTLLSTLSANDEESLLCLCVAQDDASVASVGVGGGARAGSSSSPSSSSVSGRVYAGSQGGSIHVWSLASLSRIARLSGHTGAVLALETVNENGWLISASALILLLHDTGDGTIRVWHTPTLSPLFLIHPPHDNVGDIFSLVYVPDRFISDDPPDSASSEDHGHDHEQSPVHQRAKSIWEHDGKPSSFKNAPGRGPSKKRNIPDNYAQNSHARGGGRLFAGCQDTSLQWIDLPALPSSTHAAPSDFPTSRTPTPIPSFPSPGLASSSPPIHRAPNKFFDNYDLKSRAIPLLGSPGHTTPISSTPRANTRSSSLTDLQGSSLAASGKHAVTAGASGAFAANGGDGSIDLQISEDCIATFAHYGYIYCLTSSCSNDSPIVISGSGDSLIRLWSPHRSSLSLIHTLHPPPSAPPTSEAILSLATHPTLPTLFAGHQGGLITIWDLDTFQSLRILTPHTYDVLSMVCLERGELYAGDSGGGVTRCDKAFTVVQRWQAAGDTHDSRREGAVLGMALTDGNRRGKGSEAVAGRKSLFTGGNDRFLKVCRTPIGLKASLTDVGFLGPPILQAWDLVEPPELTKEQEAAQSDKGFQGEQRGVLTIAIARSAAYAEGSTLIPTTGELFHLLSRFVAYKSIASLPKLHAEECRQTALYLKRVLRSFGASVAQVIPNEVEGKNPFVFAQFLANALPKVDSAGAPILRRKRVLFYGHYDVVAADEEKEGWTHDPWKLTGKDGWLYGRGVTDNKVQEHCRNMRSDMKLTPPVLLQGPILAIASAASSLQLSQSLPVDLVMILEGEEETGSAGFQEVIRKHRSLIGDIDVIFVSNSYWIGEDIPCVTFGLRGVIHASLKVRPNLLCISNPYCCMISSNQPDLHSGISGGVVSEPLVDMVRILSTLTSPTGQILIPNFNASVRALAPAEDALYDRIIDRCSPLLLTKGSHELDPKKSLIDRWRQPALSIHAVTTSSPSKALIPSSAESKLSIRIVPDQSLEEVIESLKRHLKDAFARLRTHNRLQVSVTTHSGAAASFALIHSTFLCAVSYEQIEINHTSTFWLASPHSPANTLLAECIHGAWGIEPLFIREGGSIPSLPFLEAEFDADAVHFPMATGQANAHLGDEKIRFEHLEKGRSIVGEWLRRLDA
ncbi:BQ5605_C015g07842 [Microbotryum silenes-dioicae]|uniref:BQ5605_C015g07842 protein n=1 Tax=Microbotryum silenes-dioicae TaxID=796604 RepID=A0A2X0MEK1_9BASI|nr:BQ5605_C015g07842 [Microbotryum silenes-dioicae]